MAYKPRPESAKGSVYEKFKAEGEAAAIKFGLAIKTRKLTEKQLARWFRKWGAALAPTMTPVVETTPAPDGKPGGKNRVYSINDLKMTGTVVAQGPTVSEIKWDDPTPWGARTSEPNTFLRPIGTNPITTNERAVFLGASHFVVMDMLKPVSAKKGEPKPPRPEQCKTFADAKKVAGKNKNMMVHAVTTGGNSIPLLRSLWAEYSKVRDIWEREEKT